MARHRIDDETRRGDEEPERERYAGEALVGRKSALHRVVEGQGHQDRDHERHRHMNSEQCEVDRANGPIAAEFRQAREGVVDKINRQERDAESDCDHHRAAMSFPIAGANAAIGVQQYDDRRRIDDGEHMRQIVYRDHRGSVSELGDLDDHADV